MGSEASLSLLLPLLSEGEDRRRFLSLLLSFAFLSLLRFLSLLPLLSLLLFLSLLRFLSFSARFRFLLLPPSFVFRCALFVPCVPERCVACSVI